MRVRILSAPGCYLHHLANILAVATDATELYDFLPVSAFGDSHGIKNNEIIDHKFATHHFHHFLTQPLLMEDRCVVINLDRSHILDYLDNDFSKYANFDFDDWFRQRLICRELMPEHLFTDILNFVSSNGASVGDARKLAPGNATWMIRELLSYKINEIMFGGYERYFLLNHPISIRTTDFFDNFGPALTKLVHDLGWRFKIPMSRILEHHADFVRLQRFNNIQILCDCYVDSAIMCKPMSNPCISLFDEAYVQSQLRHRGWEIKVDHLNLLPDAADLHSMLYAAHLKTDD